LYIETTLKVDSINNHGVSQTNFLELVNLLQLFRATIPNLVLRHFANRAEWLPKEVLIAELERYHPIPACAMQAESMEVLAYNHAFKLVYGKHHHYKFGQTPEVLLELVHLDDLKVVFDFFREILRLDIQAVTEEDIRNSAFNLRFRYRENVASNWQSVHLKFWPHLYQKDDKTYFIPVITYQDLNGMPIANGLEARLGDFYFSQNSAAHSLAYNSDRENLTPQEVRIVDYIIQGMNSISIAEKLHLAPNTVRQYRKRILTKTGCKNRAELVRLLYAAS